AALTAAGMGVLLTLLPLGGVWTFRGLTVELARPLVVMGRVVQIEAADIFVLRYIFFTAAALFLLAWRHLPHSNFFPVGLAAAALFSGAFMVEQVVYAALLVVMGAILTVFPLHESGGAARGGLRYLVYTVLALPGLMVTQLLLDLFMVFPNDQGLLNTAAVLLGVSFAILFGAVPFQSWLSAVSSDGSPPVVTYLFTVNTGTVWFLLLAYFRNYPWLSQQAAFGTLFTTLGLVMMVTGGVLAAAQQRLGRLVGYATLVDNGAMLLALGTGRMEGLALAALLLLARPFSLGLMTLGLQGLRQLTGGLDDHLALEGAAFRAPWSTMAFLVGGIALAGFPLSLGFAARWGLYRITAMTNFANAMVALGSAAAVMLGIVISMRVLLTRPVAPPGSAPVLKEDRLVVVLIVALLLVTLALGFFPSVASNLAVEMAQWYTFFP
ncbi:MAG TPA: proton-conducting transporter membrane subunit, partial [Anaerolineae bacterium]|nr:proton-conducting transporter membrane subunit [Anaerolineae bacterium]